MTKISKPLSDREFELLLTFLSDHDERTAALARDQFRAALENQPALRRLIAAVPSLRARQEAELLIEQWQVDRVRAAFRRAVRGPKDADLEAGLTLLARLEFPDLDASAIAEPLDRFAEEIDRGMANEAALPTRPIHALTRCLFQEKKFRNDTESPNDPRNSLLNSVLERRIGSPLLLSAVYLLVGRRLGLLVHGVGLPGHFIVGHRIPRGVVFIDPSQAGRVLRKKDCEVLVRRNGFLFREEQLDVVSSRDMLARALAQMIIVYTEQGATARAKALSQLYDVIPDQPGNTE